MKADEEEKKKEAEIRSERLLKKIAAKKEEVRKADKGKGKVYEVILSKIRSDPITSKATRKKPLEKSAEQIRFEEM